MSLIQPFHTEVIIGPDSLIQPFIACLNDHFHAVATQNRANCQIPLEFIIKI